MTFYLFLSDRHGTDAGARWAIMGIATKVAQSVRPVLTLLNVRNLTRDLRSVYVSWSAARRVLAWLTFVLFRPG